MVTTLRNRYFSWLCDLASSEKIEDDQCVELFYILDSIPFTYILPMDANRYEDGIALRYRFGRACGYSQSEIAYQLDTEPCSVFEMLLALAKRCDESIMGTIDEDRTSEWFWIMLNNLGIGEEYIANGIDRGEVERKVDILLERKYAKNGRGGLFIFNDPTINARQMEIWYQLMNYLNENY